MPADQANAMQQAVREVLENVTVPSGQNLVESNSLVGLALTGDRLEIMLRHPGFPPPIRSRIQRELSTKVQAKLPQLSAVEIQWQAQPQEEKPTSAPASSSAASPSPSSAQGPAGVPESLAAGVKHVIAVGSGKGGVGKSTMSAGLAYGLLKRGYKVGLMDADVYGPSLPHMLGLQGYPNIEENRLTNIPEIDGLKVISMGSMIAPDQAVIWRGPMLHKAVKDFTHHVEWGELDYLIVDLPPGTGDVILSLSQQIPVTGGVIVCTPQPVALLDARKALSMFGTVKIPCLGVIENMSYFIDPATGNRSDIFGEGGAKEWAEKNELPVLGQMPLHISLREHGEGNFRSNFADNAPAKEHFLTLADNLIQSVAQHAGQKKPSLEIA